MRIIPVNKLNAKQLKPMQLEAAVTIQQKGGHPLAFVSDNCAIIQATYKALGDPGKVNLQSLGLTVCLLFDYVHIFKNIKNNWYTDPSKRLAFTMDNADNIYSVILFVSLT